MAMNKAEKAEMERLEILAAFVRTGEVSPDIVDYTSYGDPVPGYSYNPYYHEVFESCSTNISHGYYSHTNTTAKGPIKLYSTKLLALKALRNAIELNCAEKLRNIDKQIEACEKGE